MKRLKDSYLDTIESILPLSDKNVLEIGCGNGDRTVQIAARCKAIVAIDPNEDGIRRAQQEPAGTNISYHVGSADRLPFEDHSFDVVFFTLSLHHVPVAQMSTAIDEALRVARSEGHLVFLEPAFEGSFFEAEKKFEACDGDERKEKAQAYVALLSHPHLEEVAELPDETVFQFDSLEDYTSTMSPKKGTKEEILCFLEAHQFILQARRRINIFRRKGDFNPFQSQSAACTVRDRPHDG